MDAKNRLLTAWSFTEPDRVPIELRLYGPAKDLPGADELARYGQAAGFVPPPPCPYESDSRRRQIEDFLRGLGSYQDIVRANLWRVARGGDGKREAVCYENQAS